MDSIETPSKSGVVVLEQDETTTQEGGEQCDTQV